MEPQKERIVKFFPKQFDCFNFTTQFCAAVSGVQSGKSFLGAYWAGKKILEYPKGVGIIIAPYYKILQHATLKKFFDIFPELRRYYKEQKGEIHLPTGGIIYIRSADNPLGIEGITANWWWLDEGGMCSVLTWTVLRSRVSMTGGQGLITTTPYSMNWLYQNFYIPWKEGKDKTLSFFTWKSIENPYFSQEFYDAERARLRPEEFARRYMGEFKKMEGLVWDLPSEQIIPPDETIIKRAEFVGAGVDWGWNNPAAIPVAALYDNCWYVVDDWKEQHKTTAEIIKVLDGKIKEFRIKRVFPDPSEPDRIEEMKLAGIKDSRLGDTNKDIKGGLSYIQQLINEKRFFVFDTCHNFIDEINSYHYPEGQEGKAFKDEPEKVNDHICDAVRYLIFSYVEVQPMNLSQSQESPIKPFFPELGNF